MKKKLSLGVGVVAALLVISTAGYSWNNATHAYIAGKLATLMPILKMNRAYGITAPDLFNLDFTLLNDAVLRGYTHGIPEAGGGPNEDFMAVWRNADGPFQKAAAAGWVAHNDVWGADHVAHWMAIPEPPPFTGDYVGQPPGFIIALAIELDKLMVENHIWDPIEALIAPNPLEVSDRLMFTHNVIEFAGDLIVNRKDPEIGRTLAESALARTPSFWALVMRALPHNYQPMIKGAEAAFQQQDVDLGSLLMLGNTEDAEIQIWSVLSYQMAGLVVEYLKVKTGEDFSNNLLDLTMFIDGLKDAALQICVDGNYMGEVDATVLAVAGQLDAHNITSKLLR